MRLGYACINMELQASKPKITCNRGMIRRTFDAKGLPYTSDLHLRAGTTECQRSVRDHQVEPRTQCRGVPHDVLPFPVG